MSNDSQCSHGPCSCDVGKDGGIQGEHGQSFCSEGCAKGEGCVCPECGCSMQSVDDDSGVAPAL